MTKARGRYAKNEPPRTTAQRPPQARSRDDQDHHNRRREKHVEPAEGWTYGIRAVEMALERGDAIEELWVMTGDAGASRRRVREQAAAQGLAILEREPSAFARLLGADANHQGVAARMAAFTYASEDAVLHAHGPQLIVVLDEVQDPHNLGAILRSSLGLGAAAVVIPKNRAAGVNATVRKVSAGAADRIPVAQVTNIAAFLEKAKENGFWIYGTTVDEGDAVDNVDFAERAVLVMGSEGAGIRPLVRRGCDVLLRLPIEGVESLNVSVACGIFLYALRTRTAASGAANFAPKTQP